MFSIKQLVGAVCVCACVGVASATTTKITAFFPTCGAGGANNPDVDGTGTIKYNASTAGETRFVIEVSELQPSTTYGVAVTNDVVPGAGAFFLTPDHAVTSNPGGHLVLIASYFREGVSYADPNTVVTIFAWDGRPEHLPEYPDEIPLDIARACSVPCQP